MFKALLVSFKHSLMFSLGDQYYLQVFSFLMGSEWFQEMAESHPWLHPSVASPGLRDKRLRGLLCVEGLETACLKKVPFNRDLTSKKNQTGTDLRGIMWEQHVQRLSSRVDSVYWRERTAHKVPAPCSQGQGF